MSQNSNEDSIVFYFFVCAAILLAIYFFTTSPVIHEIWKYLRIISMLPFYYAPDWMPIYGKLEVGRAVDFLYGLDFGEINKKTIILFDGVYPKYFSWILAIPFLYWGFKESNKTMQIGKKYNVDTLIDEWAPIYPHLKPFTEVNPTEKPLFYKPDDKESYEWGMSLTPIEYCTMSPPVDLIKQAKTNKSLRSPIYDEGDFDEDLATRALSAQLGQPFTSIDELSKLHRSIFDSLCPRVKMGDKEKDEMAKSSIEKVLRGKFEDEGYGYSDLKNYIGDVIEQFHAQHKKVVTKEIQKGKSKEEAVLSVMRKTGHHYKIAKSKNFIAVTSKILSRRIMEEHGFTLTGIMSLLAAARKNGVVTGYSEFRWVKVHCRTTFYTLSTAGRHTAFPEAAGIMSHWLLETQIGRPVRVPEVTEAVVGMKTALRVKDD